MTHINGQFWIVGMNIKSLADEGGGAWSTPCGTWQLNQVWHGHMYRESASEWPQALETLNYRPLHCWLWALGCISGGFVQSFCSYVQEWQIEHAWRTSRVAGNVIAGQPIYLCDPPGHSSWAPWLEGLPYKAAQFGPYNGSKQARQGIIPNQYKGIVGRPCPYIPENRVYMMKAFWKQDISLIQQYDNPINCICWGSTKTAQITPRISPPCF